MKYHRLNRAERYVINREIWRNVHYDSKASSDDDTMAHLFIMAIIILIALAIVSMIG